MGAMDLQLESAAVQHGQAKLNVEVHAQGSSLSDENYMAAKINGSNSGDYERLEKGVMQFGCAHYEGDATYRHHAAMRFFYCRHCHNEAKEMSVQIKRVHRTPLHYSCSTSFSGGVDYRFVACEFL